MRCASAACSAIGAGDNVVRILPPLIIDEDNEVREAIGILNDACA